MNKQNDVREDDVEKLSLVDFLEQELLKNENIRWRGTNIQEIIQQAKQMELRAKENTYTEEQVVIADEKIYEVGHSHSNYHIESNAFIMGAKWYKQQIQSLKQPK